MKSKMRRFHFDVGAIFADIRYGARAFFTLKGYASRIRETELTSRAGLKPEERPVTVAALV